MTIPGTRTSREIVRESRLRMETSSALECRSSWWSGRSILGSFGKTIRCVQRFRAASNRGIISAGSVTSLWAISSLNLIRSPMLTSQ